MDCAQVAEMKSLMDIHISYAHHVELGTGNMTKKEGVKMVHWGSRNVIILVFVDNVTNRL
jgi:hypothetical protein